MAYNVVVVIVIGLKYNWKFKAKTHFYPFLILHSGHMI